LTIIHKVTLNSQANTRHFIFINGKFIINPPWTLEKTLHDTLPTLAGLLAQDEGAKYTLESETT